MLSAPLSFELNRGQFDRRVRYVTRSGGATVFLTDSGAVISLPGKPIAATPRSAPLAATRRELQRRGPGSVLRMRLTGAHRPAAVAGVTRLPGTVNYLRGRDRTAWRTGIPTYRRVQFAGVYPGADLVYYGNPSRLEYDFILHPGADPKQIRLALDGASRLRLSAGGDLIANTAAGDVVLKRPYAYQMHAGRRVQVACAYTISPASQDVSFRLARYDSTRPLIVDPSVAYSTFLGGSGADDVFDIAVDPAGAAYLTGGTSSPGYPTTAGAYQVTGGAWSTFVTKLAADGSGLVYSTFIGGSATSLGRGITVGPDGSAYVAGEAADSTTFPTTPGAYQPVGAGGVDSFLLKLDPTGASLAYSTLVGGSGDEQVAGVVVDSAGRAVVAGSTLSPNFPTTPGARQTSAAGGYDAWAYKLNADASALVWSTYHGASGDERCAALGIDRFDNVYLAGVTNGSSADYPTTPGCFDTSQMAFQAGFVAELNPAATAFVYSTIIESHALPDTAYITAMSVTPDGAACVVGVTNGSAFPTTPGAYQPVPPGGWSGFATRLAPGGVTLEGSTYLDWGDTYHGEPYDVVVEPDLTVWIAGLTAGPALPWTADAFQPASAGSVDIYVARLSPALDSLTYLTNIGSSADDLATGLARGPAGTVYLAGRAGSASFPATAGAYGSAFGGGADDTVVVKFGLLPALSVVADAATGAAGWPTRLSAALHIAAGAPFAGKTVDFAIDGRPAGSAATDASGVAAVTCTVPADLADGPHRIRAAHRGDAEYGVSTGLATLTVAHLVTGLAAPDSTGRAGEAVTLTARLMTGATPVEGRVIRFFVDIGVGGYWDQATTDASGVAALHYDIPFDAPLGPRSVNASFAGDGTFSSADAVATLVVQAARVVRSTSIFVSPKVRGIGETSILTAELYDVSGSPIKVPGKTIDFQLDGVAVGSAVTRSAPLQGMATLPLAITEAIGVGNHAITASFAGDLDYRPSSGASILTVLQAATRLDGSDATVIRGRTTTLRGVLSRPGGFVAGRTITFKVDGAEVGSGVTNSSGVAACAYTAAAAVGAHVLTAEFAGDVSHLGSSATSVLTVQPPTTWLFVPAKSGRVADRIILTATLYDTATSGRLSGKTIGFAIDGVSLGSAVTVSGLATLSYLIPDALGVGDHTITATFGGDPNAAASSATAALTVSRATTRIDVMDASATTGGGTTLRAVIARLGGFVPGVSLAFSVDGVPAGAATTNASGAAALAYTASIPTGAHTITVAFAGSATNDASSSSGALTVGRDTSWLYVAPRTAEIYSKPSLGGQLRATIGNTPLIGRTLTVRVDGVPVGDVITAATPVPGAGHLSAYVVPDTLAPGAHTISVIFAGDSEDFGSSGSATLTVERATTRITGTSPTVATGRVVALVATLSRGGGYGAGKTITFKVDGAVVGAATANASGKATLSYTAALTVGAHTITAEFAGDSILKPSAVDTSLTVTP